MTWEQVVVEGQIEKTAQFGINDHSALVEKMEAAGVFTNQLPADQIGNVAAYFLTLPSEVAMKLWTVMGNGELQNTIALHQTEGVSGYIVELLTGKEA